MMKIFTDVVLLIVGAVISSTFSVFLNFALGKPAAHSGDNGGGEEIINPHAILFPWTRYLANKRLRQHLKQRDLQELRDMYDQNPGMNAYQCQLMRLQGERERVVKGREFFTWEHSTGMCIYCTNFWISATVAFIMLFLVQLSFLPTVFYFLFIPFVSHCLIKKM